MSFEAHAQQPHSDNMFGSKRSKTSTAQIGKVTLSKYHRGADSLLQAVDTPSSQDDGIETSETKLEEVPVKMEF
jgi:hypothetical protein